MKKPPRHGHAKRKRDWIEGFLLRGSATFVDRKKKKNKNACRNNE